MTTVLERVCVKRKQEFGDRKKYNKLRKDNRLQNAQTHSNSIHTYAHLVKTQYHKEMLTYMKRYCMNMQSARLKF